MTEYRSAGVDLSLVRRPPTGRVATYYLEPGASGVAARVVYDRDGTPFREASPDLFDWDALLDTRMLFVSGITLALTEATAALIYHAVATATARGIPVALDVNHRTTLWTSDAARRALTPLLDHVAVVFCSRRDAETVFGIVGGGAEVAEQLRTMSAAEHVITTDGAEAVHYTGPAGSETVPVRPVEVRDRPGAGDAFVAGTLHGLLDGGVRAGIDYGIRAAALALTSYGDLTRVSAPDVVATGSSTDADIHR